MRCPICGSTNLAVEVQALVVLAEDGGVGQLAGAGYDYSDTATAYCQHDDCNFTGPVRAFADGSETEGPLAGQPAAEQLLDLLAQAEQVLPHRPGCCRRAQMAGRCACLCRRIHEALAAAGR
jgi:hypothetical protein